MSSFILTGLLASNLFMNILPPGTVKNEATFFALLGILLALVVIAYMLRRRNRRE
ncbi:MAG TPA: LPXTG cell wall anchor domain-containing protein [Nitrososphaeraceae archaeon]|nr:LPXTG cell wall anchor domain-containing protein [Nitrososphaeraceae archaeon]